MGRHNSAVSPYRSPKNRHVIRALAAIRHFSASIGFGAPVEPLVLTVTVGLLLRHSAMNSSTVIVS